MGTIIWRPSKHRSFTRRQLLYKSGKFSVVTLVVGSFANLVAACGGDDDESTATQSAPVAATNTPIPAMPTDTVAPGEPTSTPAPTATEAPAPAATPTASTDSGGGGAQAGGTLTFATRGDVDFGSLDMTTTTGTNDLEIGRNLNEPYLWLLPDGSFAPGLAESWEISEDALQYTFKLREDVIFHDGTPMNAEAAKYNFDRMTNRETNPSGLSYSYLGAGGAGFDSTDIIDDYTFRINLTKPNAIFLFRMRRKYMAPQSPAAVDQFGADYFRNPVGCGPFQFAEWNEGDHVTFERFDEYNWGTPTLFNNTGAPYLDRLVHRIFADKTVKATALEAGEAQYASDLNVEDIVRFEEMSDIEVVIREKNGQSTQLSLNTERAPTNDLAVRQAIGWAIDREALVESLLFGLVQPAFNLFTPNMWSYDASLESLMGYDPEKAEAILDEAGWTRDGDGVRQKDGEELKLLWLLNEQTLPVGQFIQSDLRKIGMEVELQVLAGAGLTEATLKGDHNISGGSGEWIQEDPDVVRNWLHSSLIDVRQNPVRVRNPDLDALLDSGIAFLGEPHDPAREEIYKQIQRIVMEGAFVIPLYYNRSLEAYLADLAVGFQNIGFDPYGTYHEWLDIWLDE